MTTLRLQQAWVEDRFIPITIDVEAGIITSITGEPAPAGAETLPGYALPGFANVHSHVFHRFLRGRTHGGGGDFWSWRDAMYVLADRLDPDLMYEVASVGFGEMLATGYVAVGEFHYLHHAARGRPYTDPNAMGHAIAAAAQRVGIRLTLIDALYLSSGVDGSPLSGTQQRFGDAGVGAWIERNERSDLGPEVIPAVAVHSIRAVPPPAIAEAARYSTDRDEALHFHVSEQRAENQACRAANGMSPLAVFERAGAISPRTVAVHATHLEAGDVARLAAGGAGVCFCPSTERDLGDGIGPSRELAEAGVSLSLGSDSQAVIDPFEEVRGLEMNARLLDERRAVHSPLGLLAIATRQGRTALGWPGGELAVGQPADLVVVDPRQVEMVGVTGEEALAAVLFGVDRHAVTEVVVGGEVVVRDGRPIRFPEIDEARQRVWESIKAGHR